MYLSGLSLRTQDYPDIIKRPMDLSTIQRKLESNEYQEPWQVCDDVRLMFDNAMLYNKKGSRVYRAAQKVIYSSQSALAFFSFFIHPLLSASFFLSCIGSLSLSFLSSLMNI